MLDFNKMKENCTGCTACMSICPVNCIKMERDFEGFLYPAASVECIDCGKCEKICPIINGMPYTNDYRKKAFAGLTLNKNTWENSSSGGAFSEICEAWSDKNTLICGAKWNRLKVEHDCIIGVENVSVFRRSKYVESSLGSCFREIKEHLKSGKKAVFSGTPCQVAGLRAFLGKDYEKLLLIDLICHGVGSQNVFLKCVEVIGKQFGGIIESYQFRSKRKKYESDHIQKIHTNGKDLFIRNDQYIQLFLKQICLRPSCGGNCKFRTENRQGDITIADFKGLSNVFPNLLGAKYNYSTIVINSEKGNEIIGAIREKMSLKECKIDDIKKYNPLFYRQTEPAYNRDIFFNDFISNPEFAIEKWTSPAEISEESLKRKVFNLFPHSIRRYILIFIGGGGMVFENESCTISEIWINIS